MKKVLLFSFMMISAICLRAQSENHKVEMMDGNKVIVITNPSAIAAQDIAELYHVSLDVLAMYNQVNASAVFEANKEIIIPLSETNFFKTSSISSVNANFYPVYYTADTDESVTSICKKFLITTSTFTAWNKELDQNNISGLDVQVGWLKFGSKDGDAATYNTFKQTDGSIKPINFSSEIKSDWKIVKSEVNETWKNVSKSLNKGKASKEINKDVIVVVPKDVPNTNTTKNSDNFKKELNTTWQSTKSGVSKTSAKVKNAFTKKNKQPAVKANEGNAQAQSNETKIDDNASVEPFVDSVSVDAVLNDASDATEAAIEVAANTENTANKANATSGNAAWFYSGSLGTTYHVFTNAAAKGTSIELLNPETNKKITATVLGPLSKDEEEQGTVFIVSENAMQPLGAKREIIQLKMPAATN